jgi:hypothetical protein
VRRTDFVYLVHKGEGCATVAVELGVEDNKESKWHPRKRGQRDSEEESDVTQCDQLFGSV